VNYGTTCSREREKEELMDTVKINVENLLPADVGYYAFSRSLTTPPCSENVTCSC
jgi:carbonic anhydrase